MLWQYEAYDAVRDAVDAKERQRKQKAMQERLQARKRGGAVLVV